MTGHKCYAVSISHEKKIVTVHELTLSSPWAHGDHGGHGSGPNDHGSVMARRGHSSVTARSQLSHGLVTAQSRRGHSSIMASSVWCRIWSWSPMLCEKHGPRDSVDKNRGRRPRFLSLLRPEGHVFHTAWETMIKCYYSTLADWFFPCFIHINMNFSALKWTIFGSLHGC